MPEGASLRVDMTGTVSMMSPDIVTGVALLVLSAAVPLWMWLAVARNLAHVRLQRGEAWVVDRAAVPAPHRGILDAAAAEAIRAELRRAGHGANVA